MHAPTSHNSFVDAEAKGSGPDRIAPDCAG